MTDEMKKDETAEEKEETVSHTAEAGEATDAAETQTVEAETAEAEEKAEDDPLAQLQAKAAELEKKLAEANDKYLRMIAEYDNFRKRSAKEKETLYAEAVSDTIENILSIGDNLARASKFTDPESVAKGIAMMQKGFTDTLQKLGVTEIESEGKTFDPTLHEAAMHIDDEQYGEGEIVEVFQKGYKKGDRVIRYAMVKVAN